MLRLSYKEGKKGACVYVTFKIKDIQLRFSK